MSFGGTSPNFSVKYVLKKISQERLRIYNNPWIFFILMFSGLEKRFIISIQERNKKSSCNLITSGSIRDNHNSTLGYQIHGKNDYSEP